MVRVSFESSIPDLLQSTVKVTGESTVGFSCMAQHKMNLLPAYGVPTEGECMVTIGVGTAERQVEIITHPKHVLCKLYIIFNVHMTTFIVTIYKSNIPGVCYRCISMYIFFS